MIDEKLRGYIICNKRRNMVTKFFSSGEIPAATRYRYTLL